MFIHIKNSLIDTQHQWRFEAVDDTPFYPLGVKVAYKAYSSNKVVEFQKRIRANCYSDIGRATGLEPKSVVFIVRLNYIFCRRIIYSSNINIQSYTLGLQYLAT